MHELVWIKLNESKCTVKQWNLLNLSLKLKIQVCQDITVGRWVNSSGVSVVVDYPIRWLHRDRLTLLGLFDPWRWYRQVVPKRPYGVTILRFVKSQKSTASLLELYIQGHNVRSYRTCDLKYCDCPNFRLLEILEVFERNDSSCKYSFLHVSTFVVLRGKWNALFLMPVTFWIRLTTEGVWALLPYLGRL